MFCKKPKRKFIVTVKIDIEIYDRVYGIEDLHNVLKLFNDIHGNQMRAKIEKVEEVKHEK